MVYVLHSTPQIIMLVFLRRVGTCLLLDLLLLLALAFGSALRWLADPIDPASGRWKGVG